MKVINTIKKGINMYIHLLYTPLNRLKFTINGDSCGKGLKVRGIVYIFKHSADSRIVIGNNVKINSARWANPIGCGDRTYFQLIKNGTIKIGDNTGISNAALTCESNIMIGSNVLIGSGVHIYDTDFHQLYAKDLNLPKAKSVEIGNNVFIGAGSFVLKGVHIGENSIIGAASVVTRDVPANEVWAGNPAKFIKKIDGCRNG